MAPSPNNIKVRLALRAKGIPFEAVPVDPRDRSRVREVSGQDLTPVVADKGIVLNDSEAILNFLDANYDGPRLMPADREGRYACDAWKERLDRELARHWLDPFFYAIGLRPEFDPADRSAFQDALGVLDAELGERDSFHDDPTRRVCDLRVAEWACYALPGEGLIARVPLFAKFREVYAVPEGRCANLERFLRPWNEFLA